MKELPKGAKIGDIVYHKNGIKLVVGTDRQGKLCIIQYPNNPNF